jgi:hypothetical protein
VEESARKGIVQTEEPNWTGVPLSFVGKASAVCRSMADCEDLVHWFDNQADFCPDLPVLLMIPGAMKQVCGLGYATAAELRDTCMDVWGVTTQRIDRRGSVFDFDDLRERAGAMRREDVAVHAQYAFDDRVKRHKASRVTDPWRQFRYRNPHNRTVFSVNGLRNARPIRD